MVSHNVWSIKNLTITVHSYVLRWSGFFMDQTLKDSKEIIEFCILLIFFDSIVILWEGQKIRKNLPLHFKLTWKRQNFSNFLEPSQNIWILNSSKSYLIFSLKTSFISLTSSNNQFSEFRIFCLFTFLLIFLWHTFFLRHV